MKIRPANFNDLQSIMDMIRSCIEAMDAQGINQWDSEYPASDLLRTDIEAESLYLCEIDGTCCGIISLSTHQPKEYESVCWKYSAVRILTVHRLAVHPGFQRRGIANELMDFAEQYARSNGREAIRLEAYEKNPAAITFYEQRDYQKSGCVVFRDRSFLCFEKKL